MSDQKKRVILTTYLGLIPFYTTSILEILNYNDLFFKNISNFEKIPFIYGSIIVSFLSGMQWQKIIDANIKGLFFFSPLIPLLLVSTHALNVNRIYSSFIIVMSLLLSLLIDLILIKKKSDKWFKKLRINATILASLSLLL